MQQQQQQRRQQQRSARGTGWLQCAPSKWPPGQRRAARDVGDRHQQTTTTTTTATSCSSLMQAHVGARDLVVCVCLAADRAPPQNSLTGRPSGRVEGWQGQRHVLNAISFSAGKSVQRQGQLHLAGSAWVGPGQARLQRLERYCSRLLAQHTRLPHSAATDLE